MHNDRAKQNFLKFGGIPFFEMTSKSAILPSLKLFSPSTLNKWKEFGSSFVSNTIYLTHKSFLVRVPVLSAQITLVQPRICTFLSFLIITRKFAILFAPIAKHVAINAGRPKIKYFQTTFWQYCNSESD
jgi:hypothetical protein